MLLGLVQKTAKKKSVSFAVTLRHLGVFGLFSLAILDSSPLPTFGGPDILTAILAARHHSPWYEYSAAATAGSLLGAFITFRLARHAGLAYLDKYFGKTRVESISRLFERWGTGALAVSAAVPFPTPTSMFFAIAGAAKYPVKKFLIVVGVSRAVRYSLIAILAYHYGRHFVRAFQHPSQYWGWLLLLTVVIAGVAVSAVLINKRMETPSNAG